MASMRLTSLAQTENLGWFLAGYAHMRIPYLLRGPLGSGKTTLISSLVSHLENSQAAEVSSPSFSIYNIYPTTPAVIHADLYRCKADFPEELYELADQGLLAVEWAEYFQPLPRNYLDISFNMDKNFRLVTLSGCGRGKLIEKGALSCLKLLSPPED